MSEPIQRILEQELGKAGAAGASHGFELAAAMAEAAGAGHLPDVADAIKRGTARGAEFAARRMPNNTFQADVALGMSPARALGMFAAALDTVGRSLAGDPDRANPTLRAVVMAGAMNMNPAVVDIEIFALGPETCRATLTGTAKEGLIKQRAGEKAVRSILDAVGLVETGK